MINEDGEVLSSRATIIHKLCSEYVPYIEVHSKQVIPAVTTVGNDHINERGIYEGVTR